MRAFCRSASPTVNSDAVSSTRNAHIHPRATVLPDVAGNVEKLSPPRVHSSRVLKPPEVDDSLTQNSPTSLMPCPLHSPAFTPCNEDLAGLSGRRS